MAASRFKLAPKFQKYPQIAFYIIFCRENFVGFQFSELVDHKIWKV